MFHRRLILAGLISAVAAPALAQGKKGSGDGSAASPAMDIQGTYEAVGRNPDGTGYTSPVEVIQTGQAVEFAWINEGSTTRGAGTMEGRIVTVDWGDTTPVIYVVMDEGELHGTWADGLGVEKLTPQ